MHLLNTVKLCGFSLPLWLSSWLSSSNPIFQAPYGLTNPLIRHLFILLRFNVSLPLCEQCVLCVCFVHAINIRREKWNLCMSESENRQLTSINEAAYARSPPSSCRCAVRPEDSLKAFANFKLPKTQDSKLMKADTKSVYRSECLHCYFMAFDSLHGDGKQSILNRAHSTHTASTNVEISWNVYQLKKPQYKYQEKCRKLLKVHETDKTGELHVSSAVSLERNFVFIFRNWH